MFHLRSGAVEAWRAHNPQVPGSKPGSESASRSATHGKVEDVGFKWHSFKVLFALANTINENYKSPMNDLPTRVFSTHFAKKKKKKCLPIYEYCFPNRPDIIWRNFPNFAYSVSIVPCMCRYIGVSTFTYSGGLDTLLFSQYGNLVGYG